MIRSNCGFNSDQTLKVWISFCVYLQRQLPTGNGQEKIWSVCTVWCLKVQSVNYNISALINLKLHYCIALFVATGKRHLLFISWSSSLSITKDQELQQPDFSIAIWSAHTCNTQLGPSDKAARELWMSLPASTSYPNNAICVKVQRSISAVQAVKWHNSCQVMFPQRSEWK